MSIGRYATALSIVAGLAFFGCGSSDGDESPSTDDALNLDTSYQNEPYYSYQWHIDSSENETQTQVFQEALDDDTKGGIDPDADINIKEAWKHTRGENVIVAVIDDGIDVDHEDLAENIYKVYNADDGSDDVGNYSDDPDLGSHGNTCAGFIAAPINSIGTVGTAPSSKLIGIKLESQSDSDTSKAFEYARDNGAKVISCSWGTEQVSEAIVEELKSLYDDGITLLFASGNDAKDLDDEAIDDESEVEWVIGVGASAENNDVASAYSNYGQNMDVIAPGGDTEYSIGLLGLDDTGTQGSKENHGLVTDSYAFENGTSFATPVTAGVVALMYSVNPDITPAQVRDILISTADKVGGTDASYRLNAETGHTFDQHRAYGKINAAKAVEAAKALLQ